MTRAVLYIHEFFVKQSLYLHLVSVYDHLHKIARALFLFRNIKFQFNFSFRLFTRNIQIQLTQAFITHRKFATMKIVA